VKAFGKLIAAAGVVFFLLVGFVVVVSGGPDSNPVAAGAVCAPSAERTGTSSGSGPVAGYAGVQLDNAAKIISAGKALGLSAKGQTIGVMTAMGESSLTVIDYGDTAGPDSRGLFQQRGNGAWGSYADRMDPVISATNFFKALQRVPGWESMDPTIAAHRVQGNADPFHYTRFWGPAVQVYAAVSGNALPASDCTGVAGAAGQGDDYPFSGKPHCIIEDNYTCPAGSLNTATTFYFRECVDFAWYRFEQQVGSGSKITPGAIGAGNAVTWKAAWDRQGWKTGSAPVVGAIAWFDANFKSPSLVTGPMGHVGVVKAVNGDRVVIEAYNGMGPPDDHKYSTIEVPAGFPSAYLYIPSKADMRLAA
jgi:surface antigen